MKTSNPTRPFLSLFLCTTHFDLRDIYTKVMSLSQQLKDVMDHLANLQTEDDLSDSSTDEDEDSWSLEVPALKIGEPRLGKKFA